MARRLPVGTVRVRTRHKRGGVQRAWIKTKHPATWRLRAVVVWEAAHGPVPDGFVVHHKDENKLNDDLSNLELMTRAEHLEEHRGGFDERRAASSTAARRRLRWSTKSLTKRTGRPPKYSAVHLAAALLACREGMNPHAASKRFGVSSTTLRRKLTGKR